MSGDLVTRYWVAMAQAMTATYTPAPAQVLAIGGKASTELGPCSAAPAAQLTGLAARAHAALGDPAAARAQLTAAERIAGGLAGAQADEVFFGFPGRRCRPAAGTMRGLRGARWGAADVQAAVDGRPSPTESVGAGGVRSPGPPGDTEGAGGRGIRSDHTGPDNHELPMQTCAYYVVVVQERRRGRAGLEVKASGT